MSMPRAVRHINETRVLDTLYRQGSQSRADLARQLGLMRSTVGNLVAGMIKQGLVVEVAGHFPAGTGETGDGGDSGDSGLDRNTSRSARIGRPGQLVALNGQHSAFLGLDLGVGHMAVAAVDLTGRVCWRRSVTAPVAFGRVDSAVKRAVALIGQALQALGPSRQVQGLTVVVPGLVGPQGTVLRAPLLGWRDVDLGQRLQDALTQNLPGGLHAPKAWARTPLLENDANAFAAAEMFRGEAHTAGDGLFVYMDAGVGGGLASAGRLLRGHRGHAGEIGHIHLGEQGFDPRAALRGSFESYVGRDAVLARFAQHRGATTPARRGQASGARNGRGNAGVGPVPITWRGFIAALDAQVPAALHTLADWSWWMGRGLASLISVIDPSRIVLGGPVAVLYRYGEEALLASLRQHLVAPAVLPAIELSDQGAEACAVGGALLLHRAHLSIDERLVFGAGAPAR